MLRKVSFARTHANSAGSSKRPETLIHLPTPTSLARLPLLRFASNAGKAIGHTGQESSHRIKPVQIKKLNKQLLVDRAPRCNEESQSYVQLDPVQFSIEPVHVQKGRTNRGRPRF